MKLCFQHGDPTSNSKGLTLESDLKIKLQGGREVALGGPGRSMLLGYQGMSRRFLRVHIKPPLIDRLKSINQGLTAHLFALHQRPRRVEPQTITIQIYSLPLDRAHFIWEGVLLVTKKIWDPPDEFGVQGAPYFNHAVWFKITGDPAFLKHWGFRGPLECYLGPAGTVVNPLYPSM